VAFTDAIRDAIARLALHSPSSAGEPYAQWSLRRLRDHLLHRGVVQAISVEGLRQQLRGLPLPQIYWHRVAHPRAPLSPDLHRALESLAQGPRHDRRVRAQIVLASSRGLNEVDIAAALHLGRETVRRWLRRFRRHGILGLQTPPRRATVTHIIRRAIVRIAAGDPRRYGVNRTHWSLHTLQAALIRHRIVRAISVDDLRRILADAGAPLREARPVSYPARSPAVG
jgi:transposase